MASNESQAIEGYGCACGYKTDDIKSMRIHQLKEGKKQPGVHKSLGRVNLVTGDVIIPPWNERTDEEKGATSYAVRKDNARSSTTSLSTTKITENLSEASEIKFVPRVYTATLSPILQTAFVAAQRVWKWRSDMPLVNFLDTCIYNYFKEHGITLAAYVIDDSLLDDGDDDGVHGSPEEPIPEPPAEASLLPPKENKEKVAA